MFFACMLWATSVAQAQVAVNLPSDQLIDPLAAFQVCGTVRIDSLPLSSVPTHVIILDQNDTILHKIPFATFISLIQQSSSPIPIIRTYTSNNTWTKPPGLKYIVVEMVGGGGGGGGCHQYGGGAGAAGGYTRKTISAAVLNTTEIITIGEAGTGSPAQFPGGDGGTSSFGAHCSATGGQGGRAQTPIIISSDGSYGGIGINGDINLVGASSGGATASGQPLYCGASSYFGGGAPPRAHTTSSNGLAATGYGSGGGGGNGNGSPNNSGGAGSGGYISITEYY